MPPTVSVILPTRNRASLVVTALESVFVQAGLGEDFELEVFVVDDASDIDVTPGLRELYPGVIALRLDVNVGPAAARNRALALATGDYVAFLDDDDAWLPDKLRHEVALLEEDPESGALYGQARDATGGLWPKAPQPSGHIFRDLLMNPLSMIHMSTLLVRRTVLDDVGHFDERILTDVGEDLDLWLRLAYQSPFIFSAGAMTLDGTSPGGLTAASVNTGSAEAVLQTVLDRAIALLPDDEACSVRNEARSRLDVALANWFATAGHPESTRGLLEQAMAIWPPLVVDEQLGAVLNHAVEALAAASPTSLSSALALCAGTAAAFSGFHLRRWLAERRVLSEMWIATARGALHGQSARRVVAARAILHALATDIRSAARRRTWKTLLELAGAKRLVT